MVADPSHASIDVTARDPDHRNQAILQIVPRLDAGGAERTTIDIAQALTASGYKALVASEGGRMEGELAAAGGELIRMRAASKSPLTILASALRLKTLITARNVRLVHARSRAPAWGALLAARLAGVPFVATYHGIYNASNPLKRWYNSVMVRGSAVIANSEWTAAHIASEHDAHAARVTVIPRGIDTMRFDPHGIAPDKVVALRQEWGAQPRDIVVLLPGRLTRWKGQMVLITALAKMKAEGKLPKLIAVLAGDAQGRDLYEAELHKAIAENGLERVVHIPGHVENMAAAYLAADIVVSASTEPEAFGRVPVEAACMGKPVIATDHGGARETVLSGRSGLLTPPGDAVALADALEKVIAMDEDGRRAMGAEGREYVLGRYTRERMCAATLALYRELIGG